MKLARAGNKYLADTEPWKIIKTDPERVKTIMNIAIQITANLAIVFEPFMPHKANDLANLVNMELPKWAKAGNDDLVKAGHLINKPRILFKRLKMFKLKSKSPS